MSYKRSILTSASEDRLEKLIEERISAATQNEKDAIDKRIWDLFGETWCVMATDLSGFSRHVSTFGITHFLQTILESERLLIPIIEDHDGILLKIEGDSFFVIFRNVEKAVRASLLMQKKLAIYNEKRLDEEKVLLCVGLGYGKVLRVGDEDVYGAEVNAASKLGEDTASSYEILATENVMKACAEMKDVTFQKIESIPPGAHAAFRIVQK